MKTEYKISEVAKAVGGKLAVRDKKEAVINGILIDSRKLIHAGETLFFALPGLKLDGHNYIDELYKKGVRNFVVTKETLLEKFPDANFIVVKDPLLALQKLGGYHRGKLSFL
jgi:Alr-MurF fusion protein